MGVLVPLSCSVLPEHGPLVLRLGFVFFLLAADSTIPEWTRTKKKLALFERSQARHAVFPSTNFAMKSTYCRSWLFACRHRFQSCTAPDVADFGRAEVENHETSHTVQSCLWSTFGSLSLGRAKTHEENAQATGQSPRFASFWWAGWCRSVVIAASAIAICFFMFLHFCPRACSTETEN